MSNQITVRAVGGRELLALLPGLAGTPLRRSLVCVAFRGSTVIGVLRHDLPRRMADHPVLVSAIVGAVCRIEGADGIIIVAHTDRSYPRTNGTAERRLIDRTSARLEEAGFDVLDGFLVSATGWGSINDPLVPPGGRALELIEDAAVELAPLVPASASDSAPAMDRARAGRLRRRLASIRNRAVPHWMEEELGTEADPVALVERVLAARETTASQAAWFAELAGSAVFRDAMVVQIAFGASVGELALHGVAAELNRFEGMSDALPARPEDAPDGRDEFVSELYLGRTRLRPDSRRITTGIGFAEQLLVDLPRAYRPGVHCIAAWLHWALGRGSRAGVHLVAALNIDPDHGMARLLEVYIGSGALPEWAFVRSEAQDALLGDG
ncbi:DUF4192 family protein [Agromyces mediolanus]|uniref:DUF4192 family protein n=1 Tax=Agromyces mediolanus TaxID=41986 RepID=UPI0038383016